MHEQPTCPSQAKWFTACYAKEQVRRHVSALSRVNKDVVIPACRSYECVHVLLRSLPSEVCWTDEYSEELCCDRPCAQTEGQGLGFS